MILAGHETTGTALFWALYLLALDPATQDELAAEVQGVSVNGTFDIERLKFTRAVVDETMRLYPAGVSDRARRRRARYHRRHAGQQARRGADRAVAVASA